MNGLDRLIKEEQIARKKALAHENRAQHYWNLANELLLKIQEEGSAHDNLADPEQ